MKRLLILFATGLAFAGQPRVVYWIGTNANQVLRSPQVDSLLSGRAAVLILRAPLSGIGPEYDYVPVVSALHRGVPGMKILTYSWATMYSPASNRIEKEAWKGYDAASGPDMLRTKSGALLQNGRTIFGDVCSTRFQEWVAGRSAAIVRATGTDGIAFDLSGRRPRPALAKALGVPEAQFRESYARGVDAVFAQIRAQLPDKLVIYNGLWSSVAHLTEEDQAKLLAYTDGAAIEYFGMDPLRKKCGFENDVLAYLHTIAANPGKMFLVFGRGPWTYEDYDKDYLWQRYLFGAYLLAERPNTFFKYHSSFQTPAHEGRSGGLDTYGDWDLDFGRPLETFREERGVYSRRFEQGLVLVSPEGGEYTLERDWFDPEGRSYRGAVRLEAKQALLLLPAKPRSRGVITLGSQRLDALPPEKAWEHDLLLDPVRTLHAPTHLSIRLRTRDANARVFLIAEVDDALRKETQVALALPETAADRRLGWITFRVPEEKMPMVVLPGGALTADGAWHDYTLDGGLMPSRFKLKRWRHLRAIGAMEIGRITVQP